MSLFRKHPKIRDTPRPEPIPLITVRIGVVEIRESDVTLRFTIGERGREVTLHEDENVTLQLTAIPVP